MAADGTSLVVLSGSPHKTGNIAECVGAILRGAQRAGIECKHYFLKEKNISECAGCRLCVKNGGSCALKDDMGEILNAIKEADIVLIASPIYICQINGITKTLLDRLYPLTDEHHKPRYGTKKLIMLYTYGAPIPFLFRRYIRYNGRALRYMGLRLKKSLVFSGCTEPGSMKKRQGKLERLERFGESLR